MFGVAALAADAGAAAEALTAAGAGSRCSPDSSRYSAAMRMETPLRTCASTVERGESAAAADSPRSTVLAQVRNGVSIRIAALYLLLSGEHREPAPAAVRASAAAPASAANAATPNITYSHQEIH